MTPKVKTPAPPKIPVSAADMLPPTNPDDTSTAYSSLINTGPGLQRKASTAKKTLLGGA